MRRPTLSRLQCLRYFIKAASIYREQHAPNQLHTQRWSSMAMVDITDWASSEIKTIYIAHVGMNTSYPLHVRKFVPVEGDSMVARWHDNEGVETVIPVPPYAIVNMAEAAWMFKPFIWSTVHDHVEAFVDMSDPLLAGTYRMALKQSVEAHVSAIPCLPPPFSRATYPKRDEG
jgi:hypothetical protein